MTLLLASPNWFFPRLTGANISTIKEQPNNHGSFIKLVGSIGWVFWIYISISFGDDLLGQAHDVFFVEFSVIELGPKNPLDFVWCWLVAYYSIPCILSNIMPFDWKARIKNQNQLICRTTGVTSLKVTRWTLETYTKTDSFERWQITTSSMCILFLGFIYLWCHVLNETHMCRCQREKILTSQNSRLRLVFGKEMERWLQPLVTCLCCFCFHETSRMCFAGWCIRLDILYTTTICREIYTKDGTVIHTRWCWCHYIMADHSVISFAWPFFRVIGLNEQWKTFWMLDDFYGWVPLPFIGASLPIGFMYGIFKKTFTKTNQPTYHKYMDPMG